MDKDVILRAVDIRKRYHGEEVLRGVSLTLGRGEVKVLIGASGSGKSTLLRCLALLEELDGGRIELEGRIVAAGGRRRRERELARDRASIGLVFQGFHLFPHMTAMRNVAIGPEIVLGASREEAEGDAQRLLIRFGLADKLDAYPHELSGGQQQRVAIARALIMHPKVLLLDEPTAALDAELVHEVIDVLDLLAREGVTMLVVTHELAFARQTAHHVAMMADGVIIEEAPATEFFRNPAHERTRQFLRALIG